MKLQKKGLLSDCEHLFEPLTIDQEGNLKGGFATMSGESRASVNRGCYNPECVNQSCENMMCVNPYCGNAECSNSDCGNTKCYQATKAPTPTVTPPTTVAAKASVGLLGIL